MPGTIQGVSLRGQEAKPFRVQDHDVFSHPLPQKPKARIKSWGCGLECTPLEQWPTGTEMAGMPAMLALIVNRMSSPVWGRSVSPIAKASSLYGHSPSQPGSIVSSGSQPYGAASVHALHGRRRHMMMHHASACCAQERLGACWTQYYVCRRLAFLRATCIAELQLCALQALATEFLLPAVGCVLGASTRGHLMMGAVVPVVGVAT